MARALHIEVFMKTDTMSRDDMVPAKYSKGTQAALRNAARRKPGSSKAISVAAYIEIGRDWVVFDGKQIALVFENGKARAFNF